MDKRWGMQMGKTVTRIRCQAQAAGKLYLAGEYAVVEPGHPAVVVAVNRMLTAEVTGCKGDEDTVNLSALVSDIDLQCGKIESVGRPQDSLQWHREHGIITPDSECAQNSYILAALQTVEELAVYKGVLVRPFDVSISSQLDADSCKKYGLGSSAAVTVATVRALLQFYGIELSPLATYKLAYLATGKAQSLGSGGDLAASLFGGCIRFCSPDRIWVRSLADQVPLAELVERPWPGLAINRLDAFGDDSALQLLVGWTGSPASTPSLVASVKAGSADGKRHDYEEFLSSSDVCVDALARALETGDIAAVNNQIVRARDLLSGLSQLTDTAIETDALRALVEIAAKYGGAAKSSGAGGGDCGIAIVAADHQAQAQSIEDAWAASGIEPLGLAVSNELVPVQPWSPTESQENEAA
ncbi:phosphomevalonate kinase [Bombiscardovia coagulans]|uniref:phosphomevalonate kinase n=1 Tax=Bombiscardovia coagulans TaxID=686666 RepID=A0A261EU91_9BIFI|nr:phosphomevalonate kinase [Bombiscardovia coagulans]OZG50428.1 phosphomevalonate kinase [Bombiscardovia coagulans]